VTPPPDEGDEDMIALPEAQDSAFRVRVASR